MANIAFSRFPQFRFLPSDEGFPPLLTPAGLSLPRGKITELYGKGTSGGTTLLLSALAKAAGEEETCVYIDASDTLDAGSAGGVGVGLHRLLWVRCGGDAPRALKAADLVLQAGSFGLVVLDLGDVPVQMTRRIPLNYWYRFRRAVEGTRTIFLVLGQEPNARQCASLSVEAARSGVVWPREQRCSRLLAGVSFRLAPRKPVGARTTLIEASTREPWQPMIAE
jgi:hypothetical protein